MYYRDVGVVWLASSQVIISLTITMNQLQHAAAAGASGPVPRAQLDNSFELLLSLEEEAAAVDSRQDHGLFMAAVTAAASSCHCNSSCCCLLQPRAGGGRRRRRCTLSQARCPATKCSATRRNRHRAQRQAGRAVPSWTTFARMHSLGRTFGPNRAGRRALGESRAATG